MKHVATMPVAELRPSPLGGLANIESATQALHRAHASHHFHHATAFHLLHHVLHLVELLDQAVHVLNLHAGTRGDAPLSLGLDQLRLASLQACHRADDAFHATHVAFGAVHVRGAGCA